MNIKIPKIIAVGCGSEGNYAISRLFKSGVAHLKTIAIDTDRSSLDKVQANVLWGSVETRIIMANYAA